MGVATQIRSELGDCHPLCKLADTILHESQDLNFQLCNIMVAADLESGDCSAEIGKVDIVALFKGIIDSYAPHIEGKHLSIRTENSSDAALFVTDAPKVGLIFSNLLDNAVKFSNNGGVISIQVQCDENELTVTVSDFGIGIAPGDHDRIYDRFLQLDSGTTRAHRGHGLGLSIVKAILDLLNGTILMESAPGKGTRFSFTIPVLDPTDSIDIFADDSNLMIFDQTRKI
jgi:signal transduction histidine kinase